MMTKEQIIKDTFLYYNEDPSRRSLDNNGFDCLYCDSEGKKCAFGRYMKSEYINDPRCKELIEIESLAKSFGLSSYNELLKEEVRGHEIEFWENLQSLHDMSYYWCENGITGGGYYYLMKLNDKWSAKNKKRNYYFR